MIVNCDHLDWYTLECWGTGSYELNWNHECMNWLLDRRIPHVLCVGVKVRPNDGFFIEEATFNIEFEEDTDAVLFRFQWCEPEV